MAIASPTTNCIVVDVVGANPFGQASVALGNINEISEDCDSKLSDEEVKLISPILFSLEK